MTEAVESFFRSLVTPALNSLLDLLGRTLLTTPTLGQLPRIGQLWHSSWQIMLACYGMLVLIGGILVMTYETVQTRNSIKDVLPRVVIGFVAGALSLWVCSQTIHIANALTRAVTSSGIDEKSAAETLAKLLLGAFNDGFFTVFVGLFLAVMLVAVLLTYIVRVALTVILVAGAPLALMCHALPQTEGIAKWWWKAFTGCLAIQVAQSLTLVTALNIFLSPGGFTFFGPTRDGLVNLLVSVALMYILFKIPFWILGSVRGGGRSFIGSLVKGFLAYKTFGLLGGGGRAGSAKSRGAAKSSASGEADPYAKTPVTSGGQYMLPLPGLKRGRLPQPPHKHYAPRRQAGRGATSSTRERGWQPALFSRSGEPMAAARPMASHPGAMRLRTEPGEQTMLPIIARHQPQRQSRRSVHDDLTAPPAESSRSPGQEALFTPGGRINARARPERSRPEPARPAPGEQMPLPLAGRWPADFTAPASSRRNQPTPEEHQPATPRQVRGQQALFRTTGEPTPRAMPRRGRQHKQPEDPQLPLPLPGRWPAPAAPTSQPRREPDVQPARRGEVRGQQALFHTTGQPTQRAMPRKRDRRGHPQSPSSRRAPRPTESPRREGGGSR